MDMVKDDALLDELYNAKLPPPREKPPREKPPREKQRGETLLNGKHSTSFTSNKPKGTTHLQTDVGSNCIQEKNNNPSEFHRHNQDTNNNSEEVFSSYINADIEDANNSNEDSYSDFEGYDVSSEESYWSGASSEKYDWSDCDVIGLEDSPIKLDRRSDNMCLTMPLNRAIFSPRAILDEHFARIRKTTREPLVKLILFLIHLLLAFIRYIVAEEYSPLTDEYSPLAGEYSPLAEYSPQFSSLVQIFGQCSNRLLPWFGVDYFFPRVHSLTQLLMERIPSKGWSWFQVSSLFSSVCSSLWLQCSSLLPWFGVDYFFTQARALSQLLMDHIPSKGCISYSWFQVDYLFSSVRLNLRLRIALPHGGSMSFTWPLVDSNSPEASSILQFHLPSKLGVDSQISSISQVLLDYLSSKLQVDTPSKLQADAPSKFGVDFKLQADAPSKFGVDFKLQVDAPSKFGVDFKLQVVAPSKFEVDCPPFKLYSIFLPLLDMLLGSKLAIDFPSYPSTQEVGHGVTCFLRTMATLLPSFHGDLDKPRPFQKQRWAPFFRGDKPLPFLKKPCPLQEGKLNPARHDQKQPHPVHADRKQPHPVCADRKQPHPVRADRKQSHPVHADRKQSHPVRADRKQSHPVRADRKQPHPVCGDRKQPHPVCADRKQPHPVCGDRKQPHPVRADRKQTHPVRADRKQPHPVCGDRKQPYPVRADRKQPHPVRSDRKQPHPVRADRKQPHPVCGDRKQPHPVCGDRKRPHGNQKVPHPARGDRKQSYPPHCVRKQPHPPHPDRKKQCPPQCDRKGLYPPHRKQPHPFFQERKWPHLTRQSSGGRSCDGSHESLGDHDDESSHEGSDDEDSSHQGSGDEDSSHQGSGDDDFGSGDESCPDDDDGGSSNGADGKSLYRRSSPPSEESSQLHDSVGAPNFVYLLPPEPPLVEWTHPPENQPVQDNAPHTNKQQPYCTVYPLPDNILGLEMVVAHNCMFQENPTVAKASEEDGKSCLVYSHTNSPYLTTHVDDPDVSIPDPGKAVSIPGEAAGADYGVGVFTEYALATVVCAPGHVSDAIEFLSQPAARTDKQKPLFDNRETDYTAFNKAYGEEEVTQTVSS